MEGGEREESDLLLYRAKKQPRQKRCSTMDRDPLGEDGSNGRLGRSRDTRYGTRGPGSRADRNDKT